MRFDSINIPAFGPFTEFNQEFGNSGYDIHLIYGANEAGKSSLLRGIHQMFFGIPSQTKDNFIHPNPKLRIGGTISNTAASLSFLRKKGNKNTLLDHQGNSIDDKELGIFLGSVNGEFFDSMFGLDTQSLRNGADALLAGKGDLGTQLFSASLGGTPIDSAIQKLESEAELLFKGTAAKNKTILPALKAYKEGEKLAKSTATKVTAWNSLIKEIKAAQAAFDLADKEFNANRLEIVKLNSLSSALPSYDKFIQLSRDLVENEAPEVSSDFVDRFRRTLASYRDLARQLQILQQNIATRQNELSSIPKASEVLEQQAKIESLGSGLETYRANIEIVEHLRLDIESAQASLELFADQLDLSSADQINELTTISESRHSQYKQLAHTLNKQEQQRQSADAELVDAEARIARHESELKNFSSFPDTSEMEELIGRCNSHQHELAQQAELEDKSHDLRHSKNILKKQLQLDIEDVEIASMIVPSENAIQLEQERENELRGKIDAHQQKIEDYNEELAGEQAQLEQLKANAALYSHADLRSARQERDKLLDQLSDNHALEAEQQKQALSQLGKLITLADKIADTLHSNAENIANAQTHLAKIETLTLKKQNSQNYKQESQLELDEWAQQWQSRCTSIPAKTLSPADLLHWRSQWLELCETISALEKIDRSLEKTRGRSDELVAAMQSTLQLKETHFPALLTTLKSECKAATQAQGKVEATQDSLAEAKLKRQLSNEKLDAAESALAESQAAWGTLCTIDNFSSAITADQVIDLIQSRKSAQQEMIRHQANIKELTVKDEAIKVFEAATRKLTELLQIADQADVNTSVAMLKQQLTTTQQDHTKANTITAAIESEQKKLPQIELQIKDLKSQLEKQIQLAQANGLDDMERAILAIENKKKLTESLNSQRDTLTQLAKGLELDAFIEILDGVERDQLADKLEKLTKEAQPLQEIRDTALKHLDELKHQQSQLELASAAAAGHKQDAANALAILVKDSERFIRLQYAIHFLKDQVEAYRKESQGPMMEKTSHYFSALTSHRYSGVAAQLDEKGHPQLVAIRQEGEAQTEIHTTGLSEGTADQLYLALRLAAIDLHLDKHTPIPLILDDLLITFDDDRTKALLPVLAELSKKTQVLIFTHHQHICEIARAHAPEINYHQLPA
ncbi:YhaN family protein [Persicirhabdus sediminis]|uniref:AAA family ATPase n=1 Tax=Persicirhabdus sediminis TaxID=454144 RepID=A0A8J7MCU6_9BACT|nr:YhaN family protein [Persicirhabdus sediminis]MBK1790160.1 AAA family ATPase [Persicirhabdus sediminis]